MTISVKLIFKLQHCDVKFQDGATVRTVLAYACETFRQNEQETVILSKGRELEHDVELNTLSTSPTRPVKLMVVHKPTKSSSSSHLAFMRVTAIAGICADLRKHQDAVNALKAISPEAWTNEEATLAVATNEHLERMLVGLDSVTGLAGDDRAAKKQAVQFINQLCVQLDSLRSGTKKESVA